MCLTSLRLLCTKLYKYIDTEIGFIIIYSTFPDIKFTKNRDAVRFVRTYG